MIYPRWQVTRQYIKADMARRIVHPVGVRKLQPGTTVDHLRHVADSVAHLAVDIDLLVIHAPSLLNRVFDLLRDSPDNRERWPDVVGNRNSQVEIDPATIERVVYDERIRIYSGRQGVLKDPDQDRIRCNPRWLGGV